MKINLQTAFVAILLGSSSAYAQIKILQFVDPKQDPSLAFVDAGQNGNIKEGDLFMAARPVYGSIDADLIPTGTLKILSVYPSYALARVIEDRTEESQAAYPKFAFVMAGDLLERKSPDVKSVALALPEMVINYDELFLDPKGSPSTFELSLDGQKRLEEVVEVFGKAHLESLLIEGHTDQNGPAEINQVESYQRALTIRQYLITRLGFDEQRLIAIGQGEMEPLDTSFTPGYQNKNRRMVIKALVE